MEKWERLVSDRDDHLDRVHEAIMSYFERGENYLYRMLLEEALPLIKVSGGSISQKTPMNKVYAAIAKVFRAFREKVFTTKKKMHDNGILSKEKVESVLRQGIVDSREATYIFSLLDSGNILNEKVYFEIADGVSKDAISKIIKKTSGRIENTLGVVRNKTGGIDVKRGQIRNIIKAVELEQQVVKDIATQVMIGGNVSGLKKSLSKSLLGDGDYRGGVSRQFGNIVYQSNREKMYDIQEQLGLNKYFFYAGSKLLSQSRPICIKWAGKIITYEELVEHFVKSKFKGKPKNYKLFSNYGVGGIYCRHTAQGISKVMAFSKRPSLKQIKVA